MVLTNLVYAVELMSLTSEEDERLVQLAVAETLQSAQFIPNGCLTIVNRYLDLRATNPQAIIKPTWWEMGEMFR
jgi:hypothetical protein